MNKLKLWLLDKVFREELRQTPLIHSRVFDAGSSSSSSQSTGLVAGILSRLGLRNGDITSKDFEDPEYDLSVISTAYDTDSYIRQGVDKYVDQVFKEGWDIYGKDAGAVDYLKLRLSYMAEATNTPTSQLLIDIAEDVVKYSNCIIAKSRAKDATALPPGITVTGVNGELPVGGYFCVNVTTMKAKRDKYGTVSGWQQEVDDATVKFKPQDIVHIYYKREKGNAFGTPFLQPVLDDVRALRQAEENVLKMMYRNIHPFYHVAVGDNDTPGSTTEIEDLKSTINDMDVEGGLVTTNRVEIKPIASNQVINAEPYLRYLEERVFSGMGIPGILFGRGDTSNRSTGDNMTSEMADRIKAIQRTIEMFVNSFIIKELLLEGGYDPILNPDQNVEFKFRDNDLDLKIKSETHAVYLYEHNAITEDEMRIAIGRDVITDRSKMHQMLITKVNAELKSSGSEKSDSGSSGSGTSKETDNKQKPTNQHGTKTSPKKTTNSEETNIEIYKGMIVDIIDEVRDCMYKSIEDKEVTNLPIQLEYIKYNVDLLQSELHFTLSDRYIETVGSQVNSSKKDIMMTVDDFESTDSLKAVVDCALGVIQDTIINVQ